MLPQTSRKVHTDEVFLSRRQTSWSSRKKKKQTKSQADARAGPRVASPAARFNGSRSPRARSHQQAPCRDPNTENQS